MGMDGMALCRAAGFDRSDLSKEGMRVSEQGVITQQLMPRAGQPGRCLAMEILVPNAAIRNLIRENKIHQIYGSMQVGQDKHGMMTLNQSLMNLYLRRFISLEQALLQSNEADELKSMIEQRAAKAGLGEQRGQAR